MFDFLKGADGKYSLTKMGGYTILLAAGIVSLPALGVAVPVAIIGGAKIVLGLGAAMGFAGAKNAIDKLGKR